MAIENSSIILNTDSFQNWGLSEPNGENSENCGVVRSADKIWMDLGCSGPESFHCTICNIPTFPNFVLRGKYDFFHSKNLFELAKNKQPWPDSFNKTTLLRPPLRHPLRTAFSA